MVLAHLRRPEERLEARLNSGPGEQTGAIVFATRLLASQIPSTAPYFLEASTLQIPDPWAAMKRKTKQ